MLYIKKNRVWKNKIIKVIYLRFSFLKKQIELLITAPIKTIAANIYSVIIYKTLNIDDYI